MGWGDPIGYLGSNWNKEIGDFGIHNIWGKCCFSRSREMGQQEKPEWNDFFFNLGRDGSGYVHGNISLEEEVLILQKRDGTVPRMVSLECQEGKEFSVYTEDMHQV